jgi:hypothetical protein
VGIFFGPKIVDGVSKEAHVMPNPGELQDLLTAMAESEPSPEQSAGEEQTEFGIIAWYLSTR